MQRPRPRHGVRLLWIALLLALIVAFPSGSASAEPLLPDLFAWASDSMDLMYGGSFDTTTIANKVLYRFDGAIPNRGDGPLELRETTVGNLQTVYQRIYDSEGPVTESLIGMFADPAPTFGHLWFEGLAQYNLREVADGDGVGELLSSTDKTSMAVVDSISYNLSLPGAPVVRAYDNPLDPILGISIGWADLYGKHFEGQWVDATGLADGQYWLEVVVDPYNRVAESDETNNTTRILVDLMVPDPQILPGDFNDDGSVDAGDYVAWRDTLGQSAPRGTAADGNGNGMVDAADHAVWTARFAGAGAGMGTTVATVPEPSLICLSMGILPAMLLRRRRAACGRPR